MGKIKLFYFDARGRAELSRLILAQAGQEYEDVRIKREDWAAMKPSKIFWRLIFQSNIYRIQVLIIHCDDICMSRNYVSDMPGGQLPVLEIDGVKIGQSISIARFLANKFNLSGKTEIEKAQADMILDCIQDIGNGKKVCKLT